jgi:putative two-component system response regulator
MARVMVVDDEKSIRRTLSEFLRRDGFEVSTAENADEALRLLSANGPDVVITDIILPRVSGVALLKEIRSISPDVQVLMMTGEPTVETASEAVRSGACDYLMKPVSKEAVLRSVRHAAEIKALSDERRRLMDENRKYQKNLEQTVEERTKELRVTNDKLRETVEGTIRVIALTVESRDPYTAGHQKRVAEIAAAMAKAMGLSEERIQGIFMAGMIHDLGKIKIPAEILSKPTRLTKTEFELIQEHPRVGYDILKDINFPWPLAEMVIQHHERMDGSGYPGGLRDGEILLESRILAVADVVEAMASHRPYRAALGIETALAEITKNAGKLYDAAAAAVCVRLFRAGELKI